MLFIALPSLESILRGGYGWLLDSGVGLWEVLPTFCIERLCVEPWGLTCFYVSFCTEAALLPAFVLSGMKAACLVPGMKANWSCSELLMWQKGRRCMTSMEGNTLLCRNAATMNCGQSSGINMIRNWVLRALENSKLGIYMLLAIVLIPREWWRLDLNQGTEVDQWDGKPKHGFSVRCATHHTREK